MHIANDFIFVDLVGLRETYSSIEVGLHCDIPFYLYFVVLENLHFFKMLNSFLSFHWCWTFGFKNFMGLIFSSWNLSSLCHVICVVIEDFNMSLELFVVPCIKMISNLLLGYATMLFNWILNWCCKFYHFW
jgi:hypothetical protein